MKDFAQFIKKSFPEEDAPDKVLVRGSCISWIVTRFPALFTFDWIKKNSLGLQNLDVLQYPWLFFDIQLVYEPKDALNLVAELLNKIDHEERAVKLQTALFSMQGKFKEKTINPYIEKWKGMLPHGDHWVFKLLQETPVETPKGT